MEEKSGKGTVTSLSSLFPADEAQKAAQRVEEAISGKQNQLKNINQFLADNNNLINLISRLPDNLHHDIMVPFGKAAFFPGKLVHTNELMVLLGEGYYAERTAKQTVDFLKRRGNVLDSQVESLKSNIKDLRAEASFFDSTASESAEGLVEIREDYVGESSTEGQSKSETDNKKVGVGEDEYARMMSRLDELEKEELEAEGNHETDEDDHAHATECDNESDENEDTGIVESKNESDEDEQTYAAERNDDSHAYHEQPKASNNRLPSYSHSEIKAPPKELEGRNAEALLNRYKHQLNISDQPNCSGLTVQSVPKGDMSKKSNPADKAFQIPVAKEEIKPPSSSGSEAFTGSIVEQSSDSRTIPLDQAAKSSQLKTSEFDSSKAFTGSIVERTHTSQTTPLSQSSNSQQSKPVSRFKMQRR